ncbi:MAG TPA: hypothetical protein VHN14_37325 [Kofleriaceae bacterium]|jgi:hypothetical protein|nr:hypothetical protein [Kofleriaceae bacterium]
MERLENAHQALTSIIIRQRHPGAQEDAEEARLDVGARRDALGLRFVSTYVDRQARCLVVTLHKDTRDDEPAHRRLLERLLGDLPLRLLYGEAIAEGAPSKTEKARPLWGGVLMKSSVGYGTLSVVVERSGVPMTLLSAHVVGVDKTGQTVGQPDIASGTYGTVKVNPPYISGRLSDSALADIHPLSATGQLNTIWKAPNDAYTVVGYKASKDVPNDRNIYMQGAITVALSKGKIHATGVTWVSQFGTLTNQVLATYNSQQGDSGAPIMYFESHTRSSVYYIGIHVGRDNENGTDYAVFSPWEGIKKELGL